MICSRKYTSQAKLGVLRASLDSLHGKVGAMVTSPRMPRAPWGMVQAYLGQPMPIIHVGIALSIE